MFDHIHEWIRKHRLVKILIPVQILAQWFTNYLLPFIMEDVAKGGVIKKYQVISFA